MSMSTQKIGLRGMLTLSRLNKSSRVEMLRVESRAGRAGDDNRA